MKYRSKVIDNKISERLKEIFEYISPTYNITLEKWNHDIDHVHIWFRGRPNTEISKFINAYKSAGSRLIKNEFTQIRKSLWKEMFWSQSYCLISKGGATVDVIEQYMQSQGLESYEETKSFGRQTPAMYKADDPYLKEVDSLAIANVPLHLQQAMKTVFQVNIVSFLDSNRQSIAEKFYCMHVIERYLVVYTLFYWHNYV